MITDSSAPTWCAILSLPSTATAEEIRAAFRVAAKRSHSDHGGSDDEFRMVVGAYRAAIAACSSVPPATPLPTVEVTGGQFVPLPNGWHVFTGDGSPATITARGPTTALVIAGGYFPRGLALAAEDGAHITFDMTSTWTAVALVIRTLGRGAVVELRGSRVRLVRASIEAMHIPQGKACGTVYSVGFAMPEGTVVGKLEKGVGRRFVGTENAMTKDAP